MSCGVIVISLPEIIVRVCVLVRTNAKSTPGSIGEHAGTLFLDSTRSTSCEINLSLLGKVSPPYPPNSMLGVTGPGDQKIHSRFPTLNSGGRGGAGLGRGARRKT